MMVAWTSYIDIDPRSPNDLIEFFAGQARIARAANDAGYRSCAVDLAYDCIRDPNRRHRLDKRSPFDINSDAGFSQLC